MFSTILTKKQLMIATIGYYCYYNNNYLNYCRQHRLYRHQHRYRQIINSGQTSNSLSTRSATISSVFGQLYPYRLRTGFTLFDDQIVIERLDRSAAPLYVAVLFTNMDTGEPYQGTGCIVQSSDRSSVGTGSSSHIRIRVLTCAHVVDSQLVVDVFGTRLGPTGQPGRVVYIEPGLDLAVIDLMVSTAANIPTFQLTGQSPTAVPEFGSSVMSFGFPDDYYSLCTGIVGCPAGQTNILENYRYLAMIQHPIVDPPIPPIITGVYSGQYPAGSVDIQHSASGYSGFSGGPLVCADSIATTSGSGVGIPNLMGINHTISQSIGYAVSSSYIIDVLKQADIDKDRQLERRRLEHRPIRLGYALAYYFDSCSLTDKILDTGADGNSSLERTDEIVGLNGQFIESLDHFSELLDQLPDNQPVVLMVQTILPGVELDEPFKTIQLIQTGLTSV